MTSPGIGKTGERTEPFPVFEETSARSEIRQATSQARSLSFIPTPADGQRIPGFIADPRIREPLPQDQSQTPSFRYGDHIGSHLLAGAALHADLLIHRSGRARWVSLHRRDHLERSQPRTISTSNSGRCPANSILPPGTKVPMMPVMSEDSSRRIKDYYALVTLQRHHIGNPPESHERIEVVVRIPEEVAKTLAGGRKPAVVIYDVGSRVRNVATETAGVPNDSSLVIAIVVSTVDAVMPASLPTESNFKDQDGAEGWILPKLD